MAAGLGVAQRICCRSKSLRTWAGPVVAIRTGVFGRGGGATFGNKANCLSVARHTAVIRGTARTPPL
jgi:hypothetical protein